MTQLSHTYKSTTLAGATTAAAAATSHAIHMSAINFQLLGLAIAALWVQ